MYSSFCKQSYERQLRDSKNKIKTLENEVELLKLELQSRPSVRDLRDSQSRIKKLEAVIKRHKLGVGGEDHNTNYSTHVDDLEYLSVENCRRYLKVN